MLKDMSQMLGNANNKVPNLLIINKNFSQMETKKLVPEIVELLYLVFCDSGSMVPTKMRTNYLQKHTKTVSLYQEPKTGFQAYKNQHSCLLASA